MLKLPGKEVTKFVPYTRQIILSTIGEEQMLDKVNGSILMVYFSAIEQLAKLERGDADSSGSTLRTAGIVALILVIFGLVATAVVALATDTSGKITTPSRIVAMSFCEPRS